MPTTTKTRNQLYTQGPSIDANYGPWASVEEYMEFLHKVGKSSPFNGTTIAIEDAETKAIKKYVYQNGEWVPEGGSVVNPSQVILEGSQDLTHEEQAKVRSNLDLYSKSEHDTSLSNKINETVGNINALLATI